MLLFVSMTHCLWRTHCRCQSRRHGRKIFQSGWKQY